MRAWCDYLCALSLSIFDVFSLHSSHYSYFRSVPPQIPVNAMSGLIAITICTAKLISWPCICYFRTQQCLFRSNTRLCTTSLTFSLGLCNMNLQLACIYKSFKNKYQIKFPYCSFSHLYFCCWKFCNQFLNYIT